MKVKKKQYIPLDHDKVKKMFDGNPTFVNFFSIKGFNGPMAVYHSKTPDRTKSHKDYMILFYDHIDRLTVTGRDLGDIENSDRYRDAALCVDCDEVIYSAYRHDYNTCSCEKIFIDGGSEYTRTNCKDSLTIDVLTDEIKFNIIEIETKK